jgi:hypothetical protein
MYKNSSWLLAVSLLAGAAAPAGAQDPPYESVTLLVRAYDEVQRLGVRAGGEIWPGFRPDTVPVLYVLPDQGTLLLGWAGPLPEGFSSISDVPVAGWRSAAAPGAASTATSLEGRGTAQVVVHSLVTADILGITVHEQFHVFQASQRVPGRRFGRGENSFLVTRYPIFDEGNESAFGLEGRLLSAALASGSPEEARRLAHEFLAVREGRQRGLGPDLAEFEIMAELNEGLAQYAGLRATQLAAEISDESSRARLLEAADKTLGDLEGLITEQTLSFRLRFYSTGPAIALLLDRLAEGDWKTELQEEDLTLQDALAAASGYREREQALQREAEQEFGGAELDAMARSSVASLRVLREAQIDSALARPGVEIVVVTEAIGGVGFCGIDPQNLLQAGDGVLFHTRWFKPCAGNALQAEFTMPVVHDQNRGTLRAVIGAAEEVSVTVGGEVVDLENLQHIDRAENVGIEAPGLSMSSALAELRKRGSTLWVTLLPN